VHAAIAAPARPSGRASATTAASPQVQVAGSQYQHRVHHLRKGQSRRQAPLRGPVEPGQYVSFDYTQTLLDHRVLQSVGSVGDAYDKALVS
jgi:hypothetical protein